MGDGHIWSKEAKQCILLPSMLGCLQSNLVLKILHSYIDFK